jgi:hypothetical protein
MGWISRETYIISFEIHSFFNFCTTVTQLLCRNHISYKRAYDCALWVKNNKIRFENIAIQEAQKNVTGVFDNPLSFLFFGFFFFLNSNKNWLMWYKG